MNVTVLDQAKPDALRLLDCMEVLDQMRAKLMSGELSGFAAVALNAGGECTGWVAPAKPADRPTLGGAVAELQRTLCEGVV